MEINQISLIIGFIGAVASISGVIYGISQNKARIKLEKMVKTQLGYLSGDILNIRQNAKWGDLHFKDAHREAVSKNPDLSKIADSTLMGSRDIVAAERMLTSLLSNVRSLQESLFEISEIKQQDFYSSNIIIPQENTKETSP